MACQLHGACATVTKSLNVAAVPQFSQWRWMRLAQLKGQCCVYTATIVMRHILDVSTHLHLISINIHLSIQWSFAASPNYLTFTKFDQHKRMNEQQNQRIPNAIRNIWKYHEKVTIDELSYTHARMERRKKPAISLYKYIVSYALRLFIQAEVD